jgi:hypothetical protein
MGGDAINKFLHCPEKSRFLFFCHKILSPFSILKGLGRIDS